MSTPSIDQLANFIRSIDGRHSMGAGELAELIHGFLFPDYEDERDTEPSEAQLERMNASAFAAQERRVLAEDQIERDCRDAGRKSPFLT